MTNQPLGIADLIPEHHAGNLRGLFPTDVWFHCRRHEQARKVGVNCQTTNNAGTLTWSLESCIDVGPFMSEREANLLSDVPLSSLSRYEATSGPLGMGIE